MTRGPSVTPSRLIAASLLFTLVACSGREPTPPTIFAASSGGSGTVTVSAANPDSGQQDTTLDVHVLGSGFDRGSSAQWALNGVPSTNVKTNSTKFVSSSELVANITIAITATTGSYDILVTTSKGKKGIGTDLFTISSRPVASVTVTPATASIGVGTSWPFTATTYDVSKKILTGRLVTWSSSDVSVATVDQSGTVTGVSPGSAIITATSEGKSGTAAITTFALATNLAFSALAVGQDHTCGLSPGGAAYCWGDNYYGQLGNGIATSSPEIPWPYPQPVLGGLSFASLSAGYSATCGLDPNGATYCWGLNIFGIFGNGTTNNTLTPVRGATGLILTSLNFGADQGCGTVSGGTAYCWGWNKYGQLGDGTTITTSNPVKVAGNLSFLSLNVGSADMNCGIVAGGAAYCWGINGSGQLGAPSSDACAMPLNRKSFVQCSETPIPVSGGISFSRLFTGGSETCGLTGAGAAYCWGTNSAGQLGDGTTTNRTAPAAVTSGLQFTILTVGRNYTCGLSTGGAAYCWGDNAYGQLGDGTQIGHITPAAVLGGLSFVQLGAGDLHTCGLTATGVIYCWGQNNYGQLGNGTATNSSLPVKVLGQP